MKSSVWVAASVMTALAVSAGSACNAPNPADETKPAEQAKTAGQSRRAPWPKESDEIAVHLKQLTFVAYRGAMKNRPPRFPATTDGFAALGGDEESRKQIAEYLRHPKTGAPAEYNVGGWLMMEVHGEMPMFAFPPEADGKRFASFPDASVRLLSDAD